jgi:spore germination protein YaaH
MSDSPVSENTSPIHEDTQPYEPLQEPRQGGGCGCWLPAIISVLVALLLIGAGLFLPPVNLYDRLFGKQYAMLSAESNAVRSQDGSFTMVLDPADTGSDFGVIVGAAAPSDAAAAQALMAAPPNIVPISPVYTLDTTGDEPGKVTLNVTVPQNVSSIDLLDLYSWNAEKGAWEFVPAHLSAEGTLMATVSEIPEQLALFQSAPQGQARILVSVDVTQKLSPEVGQVANIVAPAGLQPTLDGRLIGSLAAGFTQNSGYLVMPVIRNFVDTRAIDPQTVAGILGNRSARSQHALQITTFASGGGFNGVIIDYRDLPAKERENFTAFIRELSDSLHNAGLQLGVVVPAAQNVNGVWETGAYDWQAIGKAADLVQIDLEINPTHYAAGSNQLVEAMLRWAVGEISREKLLMGLSALSVREVNGQFTTIGYDEALAGLGDVSVEAEQTEAGTVLPGSEITAALDGFKAVSGVEESIQSPYVEYTDASGTPVGRMWLTTPQALRFRMDRALPFGLSGVAFEDLLANGIANGALQSILDFKLQTPQEPVMTELALRWRIESADGVVDEVTTGLGDNLVTTLEAPDGNYAINVAVVGGDTESLRSGAAVALFQPTPTPTPEPTATPTPRPTNTPVAVAAAPQPAAPQAAAPPAAAPAAGSISVGNFEYGGHVTTPATGATGAMQRAGMNWMKVQLRYRPGDSPGVASGYINDAKSRGFKILLGVVGYPADLASGGDSYVQGFAQFLGGVAALGPDAIEVWNEPNIDREWPTGQISGSGYTNMLRQSYQAIKGANGNVMVISGAPAPTGAEAAFPGQVMNDDKWVREMVAAGGMQYMDCLGAHYNEGIIGPSQRSGDPRDGYYTRYFFGMLDTYWSISGGQKPICFTELGYLTSEGYPPLPSYFAWAQNVTLSQQAAWLAEATALASQSGKVRLLIVWNVDFSNYGSDPMAGYAMIRPGGGCPACDAMAAARG